MKSKLSEAIDSQLMPRAFRPSMVEAINEAGFEKNDYGSYFFKHNGKTILVYNSSAAKRNTFVIIYKEYRFYVSSPERFRFIFGLLKSLIKKYNNPNLSEFERNMLQNIE